MTAPATCGCPALDLWEADRAQLCTATAGVLHPCNGYLTLCPPENGCTDAIAHRCQDTGWHTASGATIGDWYRRHASRAQQLDLFEVAA